MNWGAVLFFARLRRVCAGRRVKTGMFRTKYPRFLAKAPDFSFAAPRFFLCGSPFFVRGGGVCGAQCGAMRSFSPTAGRQVPKRLANWGGGRAEAAGSRKICPVTCRRMVGVGEREATK